jgi:hypothetical protein
LKLYENGGINASVRCENWILTQKHERRRRRKKERKKERKKNSTKVMTKERRRTVLEISDLTF